MQGWLTLWDKPTLPTGQFMTWMKAEHGNHGSMPTGAVDKMPGMATPDDLEEFRSCQLTLRAEAAPWNDMSRGAEHWLTGPDEVATVLGMTGVVSSGVKNEDEGLYPVQHKYWQETLQAGLQADAAKEENR